MKLVLIEWVDSHASTTGLRWMSLEDIKANCDSMPCRSVGWLLSEENNCKMLVAHITGGEEHGLKPFGSGEMCIPNCAIVKMTVLKQPRQSKRKNH